MTKRPYKYSIALLVVVCLAASLTAINTVVAQPSITCFYTSKALRSSIGKPNGFSIYPKTLLPLYWRASMYDENLHLNNDPARFHKRSHMEPDPEIQELEDKLRQSNLIFRSDIQKLLRLAYRGSKPIRQSALDRINIALDAYEIKKKREPDAFKPYGPEQLLSQGQLHLLDQMDGVPWRIPIDAPLTGMLIVGPQQSGKSRLIVQLCLEIQRTDPEIVITLVDPKDAFRPYASLLSAEVVDLDENPISLKGPDNITEEQFVLEFMPMLADSLGLIYGVDIVNEAALIALEQKQTYLETTGQETDLCLKDVYVAIPLVPNTSSGRRLGYRDAAQTAISRVLGKQDLFACRKGISLKQLFSKNSIVNARSLVDDMQCRGLNLQFLYWKYQESRNSPETNKLKHLIIVDDASRFVGTEKIQFEAMSRTSPFGNILATLRSSGTGYGAATQLPASIDPTVLALTRTMIAIGPTSGSQHLKVIADFMSLDKEQTKAITRLSIREAVSFAPGTVYKEPVHGWVPVVADPPESTTDECFDSSSDYEIQPWHHLADIPAPAIDSKKVQPTTKLTASEKLPISSIPHDLSSDTQHLIIDCDCYPFSSVSTRMKRLGISGRAFENAKLEACEKSYLIESAAGQTVYLIPTNKTFEALQKPNPYKRATSIEHAFYVRLGCFLLDKNLRYRGIRPEVPIGKTGSTGDIVTTCHDGTMEAWEITLSAGNVLTNAIKYEKTAFAKISFLCRNSKLADAVKRYCSRSELNPELLAKLEFTFFSALLRRQRKLYRY